jgi:hypothetical protein
MSEPRCKMLPYPLLPLWLEKQGPNAFYYLSHLTFRMSGRPVGRMDLVCGHPGRHFPRFPTPASDTSFCANIRYIEKRRKVLDTYEPTFPCCWACINEKLSHYKCGLKSGSNHPHCGKSVPRHGCELVWNMIFIELNKRQGVRKMECRVGVVCTEWNDTG